MFSNQKNLQQSIEKMVSMIHDSVANGDEAYYQSGRVAAVYTLKLKGEVFKVAWSHYEIGVNAGDVFKNLHGQECKIEWVYSPDKRPLASKLNVTVDKKLDNALLRFYGELTEIEAGEKYTPTVQVWEEDIREVQEFIHEMIMKRKKRQEQALIS